MGVDSHMLSRSISQSSMGVSCYAPSVVPSDAKTGGEALKTKIDSATIKCGSPYPGARGEKIVYTLYTSSSTGMSPGEMTEAVEARVSLGRDLAYMTELCGMDCFKVAEEEGKSPAWRHNCVEDQLDCPTKVRRCRSNNACINPGFHTGPCVRFQRLKVNCDDCFDSNFATNCQPAPLHQGSGVHKQEDCEGGRNHPVVQDLGGERHRHVHGRLGLQQGSHGASHERQVVDRGWHEGRRCA